MGRRKWKRKLTLIFAVPLLKLIVFSLWRSCRIKLVIGEEHITTLLKSEQPFIPCYWHQQHIFCARYLLNKKRDGLKLGFLVSPSHDGEIAARLIKSWGALPIRGSSSHTGARAMRDMFETIKKQGVSPVTTSDGPTGPAQVFKTGTVMLSQLTQVPMLPLAYAASDGWKLNSWDRFLIPKPFSRIVVAIGEPRLAPKGKSLDELEPLRQEMEQALNRLIHDAENAL